MVPFIHVYFCVLEIKHLVKTRNNIDNINATTIYANSVIIVM